MSGDDRHLEVAWTRACDGLGIGRGTPLAASEASVLLKYLISERASVPDGPDCCARDRCRRAWVEWMAAGAEDLDRALRPGAAPAVRGVLEKDAEYTGRIIDLAVADLVSEPMAPEVCIETVPLGGLPPGGRWNHAVIFAAAPLITHEIYPLAADACVHDARAGGPFYRVLGVHGDWLSNGRARRVLWLDAERDRFCEAPLSEPVHLHSAQLLALGPQQTRCHLIWARRLTCPLVNPGPPSATADDKHGLSRRWADAGLEVPAGVLVAPGHRLAARDFLHRTGEIVVKPNDGTEGQRVRYLSASAPEAEDLLDAQLSACWEWGPARLEERRDGVVWRDPETGSCHSLAIRLHVAAGAAGLRAESGYALVGAGVDTPATRGAGGRMRPLQSVTSSLALRASGAGAAFSGADLERTRRLAEAAAGIVGGIGLSGVDLVLDATPAGEVVPVLLELNPRPAGLAHARFLPGSGEGRVEAGVSLDVWAGLAALRRKTAAE